MTPEEFKDIWEAFIEDKGLKGKISNDILVKYKSSEQWTHLLMGSAKYSNTESPLGNYIRDTFPMDNEKEWEYRTEEFKIDEIKQIAERGYSGCSQRLSVSKAASTIASASAASFFCRFTNGLT